MALSKEQNEKLAVRLSGSKQNVYNVARDLFGHEFEDSDFDLLKADTGLFRCEECCKWLGKSMEDRSIPNMCAECVDGIDG